MFPIQILYIICFKWMNYYALIISMYKRIDRPNNINNQKKKDQYFRDQIENRISCINFALAITDPIRRYIRL